MVGKNREGDGGKSFGVGHDRASFGAGSMLYASFAIALPRPTTASWLTIVSWLTPNGNTAGLIPTPLRHRPITFKIVWSLLS